MTREEAYEFIAKSVKSDVDMAEVADALKAIREEETEIIIDAVEKVFEESNISIMVKLTLFAKVQNAIYRCSMGENTDENT